MLGLTNEGFGLFAGTAVNDTSSVTAAAAAWDGMHPGANTLDSATIVKLTRTLAIIPITLALAFWQMRQAKRSAEAGDGAGEVSGTFDIKRIFPFFIVFFVLASVITTVFALPVEVTAPVKELSKFFIVMAMGGYRVQHGHRQARADRRQADPHGGVLLGGDRRGEPGYAARARGLVAHGVGAEGGMMSPCWDGRSQARACKRLYLQFATGGRPPVAAGRAKMQPMVGRMGPMAPVLWGCRQR